MLGQNQFLLIGVMVTTFTENHQMDTFLQLDAAGGVYDDDLVVGEPVDLETQIQRHIVETSQADALFGEQLYRPVGGEAGDNDEKGDEQLSAAESDELERQRYLQRVLLIEKGMQDADNEVQQRIDTMKRIVGLEDPMAQLYEYLTLKQEARREDGVNIVRDLILCANRMTNEEDSEVAMLGAFFFLCDKQQPRTRGMAAMLLVAAAMMEASNGIDHSPF